jgi:hypothetical protein
MSQYRYQEYTIEVFNDSTDGSKYTAHHGGDNQSNFPVSKHGIKVYKDDREMSNCLLLGYSGAAGVHDTCALIDNDRLLVCCSDTVFCLTLPDLNIIWHTKADGATCFQIFKLQDDYLIHGELAITRVNNAGDILWQFSSADIFVTPDSINECIVCNDHILLTDWEYNRYRIDFEGRISRTC